MAPSRIVEATSSTFCAPKWALIGMNTTSEPIHNAKFTLVWRRGCRTTYSRRSGFVGRPPMTQSCIGLNSLVDQAQPTTIDRNMYEISAATLTPFSRWLRGSKSPRKRNTTAAPIMFAMPIDAAKRISTRLISARRSAGATTEPTIGAAVVTLGSVSGDPEMCCGVDHTSDDSSRDACLPAAAHARKYAG